MALYSSLLRRRCPSFSLSATNRPHGREGGFYFRRSDTPCTGVARSGVAHIFSQFFAVATSARRRYGAALPATAKTRCPCARRGVALCTVLVDVLLPCTVPAHTIYKLSILCLVSATDVSVRYDVGFESSAGAMYQELIVYQPWQVYKLCVPPPPAGGNVD